MLKANELRLNNWVNISGSYIQLAGEKFLYILEQDGMFTRCNPIPLTPEILEKAGFECTYNSKYKQSYDHKEIGYVGVNFHAVGSMYDLQGRAFARYYSEQLRQPIEYVHQLQNLYFALTGNELEINL